MISTFISFFNLIIKYTIQSYKYELIKCYSLLYYNLSISSLKYKLLSKFDFKRDYLSFACYLKIFKCLYRKVLFLHLSAFATMVQIFFLEGGSKTIAITDALIYMFAKDNMPLSTTEKPGFVHFMRKVAPMYKVPSRKIVTKLVKSKYGCHR